MSPKNLKTLIDDTEKPLMLKYHKTLIDDTEKSKMHMHKNKSYIIIKSSINESHKKAP